MCKYVALVVLALAVSCVFAAEAPRVELGKFGVLRIGMTERQVAQATNSAPKHLYPEGEEEGCFYASVSGLPKGVSLMFLDRRLARVDVSEPGVRTRSGVGLGTAEAEVKRIYRSRLRQQPHAYDGPTGHYLTLLSSDGSLGMRFETDGVRVTNYYSGTAEAIQLKEGCQ